ncbi:MAG: thioredoxin family protein [Acidobacteria bacterium]|nr:thioredoxin family protein [Acidobacteriota bacterium]
MKKFKWLGLALVLSLLFGAVLVLPPGIKGAGGDSAAVIGSTIKDFKLSDTSGKDQWLSALKGQNGTVLIFISARCPVVRGYNERMEKLAEDYSSRGVNVIGINANSTETVDEMKAHAADYKLTFTMLRDKGNKIADMLGAQVTPEAYVLDANNKLVYHGRIDNSRTGANITANDLRDALDTMLSGKPIVKSEADAFGCSIKRGQ